MEIKNSLLKGVDPYKATLDANKAEAAKARAGQAESQQAAPAQGGDKVSLSSEARLHTVARQVASQAPEVRQEKVDSLKERVTAGDYTVDSRKVAEKLLEGDAMLAGTLDSGQG